MKILFVSHLYVPNIIGGAETSVQILAEALAKKGHEIVVLTTAVDKREHVEEINDVKVYYVRQRNVYTYPPGSSNPIAKMIWHLLNSYNPFTISPLKKIISQEKPDILHTHTLTGFSVSVWNAAKKMSVPVVHTLHAHDLLCPRTTMFRNGKTCEKQCMVCSLYSRVRIQPSQNVQTVIGVSRYILEKHLSFGFFKGVSLKTVIPNPYDPPPFSAASSSHASLRVGFLGRLHPAKGIEHLLETLLQLKQKSWECYIAGTSTDDYESFLKNKFKKENIFFLGFKKTGDFFPKIDVLAVPSFWHESQGRVILEAYAHGIPVVASQRGGMPEIVEEDKTGFLFEPNHPHELENILAQLTLEKCREMQKRCVEKSKEFLTDHIVNQHLETYQKTLA